MKWCIVMAAITVLSTASALQLKHQLPRSSPLLVGRAPRHLARCAPLSAKSPRGEGDAFRDDGSNSGRRLSSQRLKRLEEMEQAEPADKSIVLIIGGAFFAVLLVGLSFAFLNGYDGSPRV
eukprot:CAMPEP_0118974154 /NCGR_PEP_ID=MMETSP1173-20130426/11104_1 /TAXON_ID=1034831 /ORGANISM="Rhizochromulina marina cf, Strain CCMP1243" /LENGTH=120 /DNA_ID=CAMNT_0006923863 /DNA_START=19 /DNA_END=381 /DNA_ORIENTATION=+